MAVSGKSKSSEPARLLAHVERFVQGTVSKGDRVAVGLSGGVDSVVLLDILARLARRRGFALTAVHVNHQLSPDAQRWARFCRGLCRTRSIPVRIFKVEVARGNSVEQAARAARYAAFARVRADHIALAHNLDDQAETVLLQLLRGAGVKGLAAMPSVRKAEGGRRKAQPAILRPLLDVPRTQIEAYARARRLAWIEDESNADRSFLRNYLRHEVLPLIAARVPSYRTTLARAACHFAEAAGLLDDLARVDAQLAGGGQVLKVEALHRLSPARAKNLLRWFIAQHGLPMPGTERLEEALRQITSARRDAQVCVRLDGWEIRRHAGAVHLVPHADSLPARFSRPWRGEPRLPIPELGGVLVMRRSRGAGIDAAKLASDEVSVRVRRGGERIQLHPGGPHRTLKHLFQEGGVPPWERNRVPLLCCGETLVWVPGIGVAAGFAAAGNRPSLLPQWKRLPHARIPGE